MKSDGARWGLLFSAFLLGAALVVLGMRGRRDVETAIDAILQKQALGLQLQIRRAFRHGAGLDDEGAREVLEELEDQDLTALAVVGPDGRVRIRAGTFLGEGAPEDEFGGPGRAILERRFVAEGRRVRSVFRLGGLRRGLAERRGRAARRGSDGGSDGAARRELAERRGRTLRPWAVPAGIGLVIEFRPTVARAMRERARWNLVVSAVAAMVLLGSAFVFWRLVLRHERVAAQLAKDDQLKVLGEMSAVLSHELRNPLTSLKGHAQLVLEKVEGTKAEKGAARVVAETIRLERLAGHILDFARSGTVERGPVALEPLLRRVAEGFPEGRVAFAVAEGLSTWPLDERKMEQVLSNLVRNAVDASPEGEAASLTALPDRDDLLLVVRDHGAGIAAGEEEKIFEPFHTRRTRGTGLGLAVARRIVEGHGGRIGARNHRDGGAVFEVRLPPWTES